MVEYVLLASMSAVVVGLLFLRTNTAIVYLAMCAGSVLMLSSGENLGLVATSLTSGMSAAAVFAKFVLLFTPMVVCAVLLKRQVSRWLFVFSIIPAVCTACLGAVLAVPLLSEPVQQSVMVTTLWQILVQYQEMITGVGLVSALMLISMTVKKHQKHGRKHR